MHDNIGKTIKSLSIIALVCTALNCLTLFFGYDIETIDNSGHWEAVYEPIFQFPSFIGLVSFLVELAPSILFVLYIFKFCNKLKAAILVPVIFAMLPLKTLVDILNNIDDLLSEPFLLIIGLLFFVTGILAVISAFKGLNKKGFIIIAMSVRLLWQVFYFVSFFSMIDPYIATSRILFLFTLPIYNIGAIALYISLLLFGIKNRIPAILSTSPEKEEKTTDLKREALEKEVTVEQLLPAFTSAISRNCSPQQQPERLFCRKCGTRLLPDSVFCNKCGTKVKTL